MYTQPTIATQLPTVSPTISGVSSTVLPPGATVQPIGTTYNQEVIPRHIVVPPQTKHLGTTYRHFDEHKILPNGEHVDIHRVVKRDVHENIPAHVHPLSPIVREIPATRTYRVQLPAEVVNHEHIDYQTHQEVVPVVKHVPVTQEHEDVVTVKKPIVRKETVLVPRERTIVEHVPEEREYTEYQDVQEVRKRTETTLQPVVQHEVVNHTVAVPHVVQQVIPGQSTIVTTPAM